MITRVRIMCKGYCDERLFIEDIRENVFNEVTFWFQGLFYKWNKIDYLDDIKFIEEQIYCEFRFPSSFTGATQ